MKLRNTEQTEKLVYVLQLCATVEEFDAAAEAVYQRLRPELQLEGCAKGEVTRAAYEAAQGEGVFWYDAVNELLEREAPALVEQAIAQLGITLADEPVYDLTSANMTDGIVATATLIAMPEITVNKYIGFTTKCAPSPVTERDVDHFIERRRQALAELIPHKGPAVKGNIVYLTYVGFCEGKMFAGGNAAHQRIQLGAGKFIPGFEEGILGHHAGEAFEIQVNFPANYAEASLAGKPALFKCTLESTCIRQLPALNSDFARKAGDVDSMEAYRAAVRQKLEAMRLENAMAFAKAAIIRQLGDHSAGELPHALTDSAYMAQLQSFQQQLSQAHKTIDVYLKEVRQSREQLLGQLRAAAEKQVRVHFALLKIAQLEGLEPTDEELDAFIAQRAAKVRKTVEQYLADTSRRAEYRTLCATKATDFVVEHSTIAMAQG